MFYCFIYHSKDEDDDKEGDDPEKKKMLGKLSGRKNKSLFKYQKTKEVIFVNNYSLLL